MIFNRWQISSIISLLMYLIKFALKSLGQQKSPLDYPKRRTTDSAFEQTIIYTEIEDIISCLQNGKSTGPFSIPIKLLKLLNPDISKQLEHIFNHSICIGIFLTD